MLLRQWLRRCIGNRMSQLSEWQFRDAEEAKAIHVEQQLPKVYQELQYEWRHGLEVKRRHRERQAKREAEIVPMLEQTPKLVLHQASAQVPQPLDTQVFAVITLAGLQYKVTKDDVLKVEKLPYAVGSQFAAEKVLLVGTPWYTLLGRPLIPQAKVYFSVEEQTQSEKLLVFKKKRRKGYQKSLGHRQELTILRVDKIEYVVEEGQATLLPAPLQPKTS